MSVETSGIKCDIELKVTGPNDKTAAKWTADALRRIADQLEKDGYEDGHHPVTDGSGRPIGEVYFDFTEEGYL